jgi:hypothetical protein
VTDEQAAWMVVIPATIFGIISNRHFLLFAAFILGLQIALHWPCFIMMGLTLGNKIRIRRSGKE